MITNLRESVRENLINLNNETFAYIEDNDIKRLKEIKCIADNLEIMIFPLKEIEEQLYDGISALIKNVDSVIKYIENIDTNFMLLFYVDTKENSLKYEYVEKDKITEELEFTFKLFR